MNLLNLKECIQDRGLSEEGYDQHVSKNYEIRTGKLTEKY